MARVGLTLLSHLGPTDAEKQLKEIDRFVYHATLILLFCEYFDLNKIAGLVREFLEFVDFTEAETMLLPKAREQWKSKEALWAAIQEQLTGRPFTDAARIRRVEWAALGVQWEVRFANEYETTLVAEEFIAVGQILATELAPFDLCILPTRVRIDIRPEHRDIPELRAIATNDGRHWELRLPLDPKAEVHGEPYEIHLIAAVAEILREVCLASTAAFNAAFEELFKHGLTTKTFVAQPYHVVLGELMSRDDFTIHSRNLEQPPGSELEFSPKPHSELSRPTTSGPGYDSKDSLTRVQRRYERSLPTIRYTLERLKKNPEFCAAVRRIKADGWKDWHIIMGVGAIAANARAAAASTKTMPELDTLMHRLMSESEAAEAPALSDGLFAEERIRQSIKTNMLSTVKGLGLEVHQRAPDLTGIERFLAERYRYKDDDIEHTPIFDPCA